MVGEGGGGGLQQIIFEGCIPGIGTTKVGLFELQERNAMLIGNSLGVGGLQKRQMGGGEV